MTTGESAPTSGFVLQPQPDPPTITSAVLNTGTFQVTMTFSEAIQAASLDTSNWHVTYSNQAYLCVVANATGGQVVIQLASPSGGGPDDIVTFTPPPFDVVGVGGQPVAAFGSFPLTIV